jgi:dihydropteroate synthase
LGTRALVMGVLNVTPDSFSDGGLYLDPGQAVARAEAMVAQGTDLLDIGAESSRPGSDPVEEQEEIRRLLPVVKEVCRRTSVPVSVDTTKATVARLALEAGARIINDISALRFDPRMGPLVAETGAGLVLMHMQGTPKTMQRNPSYDNVLEEVRQFFVERLGASQRYGIKLDQILLDPGIGFGKSPEHNLTLLANLDELATLDRPLMVGVSRKAFIGQILDRPVGERVMGTAAAVAAAVLHGARVVRVHEVAEIRETVRLIEAVAIRRRPAAKSRPKVDR